MTVYQKQNRETIVIPAFLSLGGFTKDAISLCSEKGVGVSEKIRHF
ncbi:hypothetical protein MTBBW1_350002 [Desulfamplus magnetovallimortis]|uniref:Uncharacterized protein n=1 Tax=Desulfamplus magnetovallimortis TaxID=1246637 RepID=A0A1W1HG75_9BACT|nr:hypothetical protein MTBBW1_350002 [Desulfamplus magnetovallimortis]